MELKVEVFLISIQKYFWFIQMFDDGSTCWSVMDWSDQQHAVDLVKHWSNIVMRLLLSWLDRFTAGCELNWCHWGYILKTVPEADLQEPAAVWQLQRSQTSLSPRHNTFWLVGTEKEAGLRAWCDDGRWHIHMESTWKSDMRQESQQGQLLSARSHNEDFKLSWT